MTASAHNERFMVTLWRSSGRCIKRITYKTLTGAHNGAARESADSLIAYTMVHGPVGDDDKRPDLCTFRDGVMVAPLVTKRNADWPAVRRQVEHFEQYGTTTTTTGEAEMAKDTGAVVEKPARNSSKAKAEKVIKRRNPVSAKDLIGMSDAEIAKLPPERRPDLSSVKVSTKPYAIVYLRFLTGLRKWYPNPWMSDTSADEGRAIRKSVRRAVAGQFNVKSFNADGAAPRAEAAPKKPASKTTRKPAAKKPAAKKASGKKPAAAAKRRTTRSTTAKKRTTRRK